MAEELQLSLARWRAGEWKCGRRSGRCDRIFSGAVPASCDTRSESAVGAGSSSRATPCCRAGRRERKADAAPHCWPFDDLSDGLFDRPSDRPSDPASDVLSLMSCL